MSVCQCVLAKKIIIFHRGKFIQHHTDPITEAVFETLVCALVLAYVRTPVQVSTHIRQTVLEKIKEQELRATKEKEIRKIEGRPLIKERAACVASKQTCTSSVKTPILHVRKMNKMKVRICSITCKCLYGKDMQRLTIVGIILSPFGA